MAKSVRSRRTVIAAGALSLALVAPFVSPVQAQETTTPTSDAEPAPAEQPSTSEGTSAATFEPRFDTANFWNTDEAVVEGLQLQPGDTVAPRTNTIFNWGFNNNDGTLTLIRPKSTAAFGAGKKDIPVRVTTAAGETFDTTLRVNIINERPGAEWENQLTSRYPMDFGKSTSAQSVEGITLPEGVSVSKSGAALPTGWSVSNDGTTIRVTPPTTFKEGDFDLPIEVNDGTDTFGATLKIAAKNPSKTPAETAGTVASILGPILGSLIGAGTGGSLLGGLGDIIGGLTGGGTGGSEGGTGGGEGGTSGGEGGTSGGGAGRLINVVITNNANPSNIGNNNGSPNVVITDNVNPRDNLSNNGNPSVVITNNANPTVEIKDNLSNNANPTVVITGNANPDIRDNGNNNGSNNSVVATGNANPEVIVTDNANFGLFGSSRKRGQNGAEQDGEGNGDKGSSGSSLSDTNVNVEGGSSDPRCIASLVGLGLPLIALVPLALANQLNIDIPNTAELNAQAANVVNHAARQFGLAPEQLTAGAGALAGLVAALIVVSAANTCVPNVKSVDVNVGRRPVETVAAPVIETAGA